MDTTIADRVSNLSFQRDTRRWTILLSYWVVILAALPLWWYATSIERLSLPESRIHALKQRQLVFDVNVRVPPGRDALLFQRIFDTKVGKEHERWKGVDVHFTSESSGSAPGTYTIEESTTIGSASVVDRTLILPTSNSAFEVDAVDKLVSLLQAPQKDYQSNRVVQYAPRYKLAFSLLNEDGSSGSVVRNWDVENAVSQYLQNTLSSLSSLHNFTIESQVQFHAPLAFDPVELQGATGQVYGLIPEHLTVFVNSAQWTLSSGLGNDPVLHFLIFVPSARRRPLRILDNQDRPSDAAAFLLPQWGGIFLHDAEKSSSEILDIADLSPAFSSFSAQLQALLGVPPLPDDVRTTEALGVPNLWQIDCLMRQRALQNVHNTKETLDSILKLVDEIENMPIGKNVTGDIELALDAIEQTLDNTGSPYDTMSTSSRALTTSSRAFFSPHMLALLYFPNEHVLAVYTPLFASIGVPLIVTVIKEFKKYKATQRLKIKTE